MFRTSSILILLTSATAILATLDPATSNTKGKYPANLGCSASKTSTAIQAAECSHNTRVSGTQTFAVFTTDHQYDSAHGAPYGTCKAYTCDADTSDMVADADSWTFYWGDKEIGEEEGEGAGCIKSPDDGTCGCENSDGTFVYGGSDCV
ncbi:small secreted protein [Lophiostoma macrostomum CBS 122681]|uniref:Small secreted protein n=1 Tax=Lophiostoma macrostomum CBS 122681 TaxID=1314788 RepID=A0A6A6TL05_9PLEO|nr:small secreted protein [Lophiostoma macrostomum CBS 122681]